MSGDPEELDARRVEDLTRSSPPAPLPLPTTVSTRSLRPRRSRGTSVQSSRSSTHSSSRSRSHSIAQSSRHSRPSPRERSVSSADNTAHDDSAAADDLSMEDSDRGEGCSNGAVRRKRARSASSSASRHSTKRQKTASKETSRMPASPSPVEHHTSHSTVSDLPEDHATSRTAAATAGSSAGRSPQPAIAPVQDTSHDQYDIRALAGDPSEAFERMMAESASKSSRAQPSTGNALNEPGLNLPSAGGDYLLSASATSPFGGAFPMPHEHEPASWTHMAGSSTKHPILPSEGDDTVAGVSANPSSPIRAARASEAVPIHEVEPLASYSCPICFSPPTYATITPCGHVLCGDCLFTAVKTTQQRGAYTLPAGERMVARCPVCRAPIPGWDGKGGGVIGLRPRAVFSL